MTLEREMLGSFSRPNDCEHPIRRASTATSHVNIVTKQLGERYVVSFRPLAIAGKRQKSQRAKLSKHQVALRRDQLNKYA